jgi:2-keto-4-pentenoate hydratase/2-oxohepta-3-ene-1,7-dioic acid hydratase in catechol pathway
MKVRRAIAQPAPGHTGWQYQRGSDWIALLAGTPEADSLAWLTALPSLRANTTGAPLLPFQPLSFRDCMLYEQHWVQSSRAYAKRFLPGTAPFTQLYERLLRRPFPAFRPHRLWHRQPIYYFGNHLTMVPGGTPVRTPSYTHALDYELELGWVLSKPLYNATPDEALAAIGGFVVVNDFSARDVQREEMNTGLGPQKSKHFLSSMSPTLITADEILPMIDKLQARVEINGQCVTRTATAGMRYHPAEVLAHLSRDEQLYPGELIASGTLPSGSGMETGHWLKSGDTLRLVIEPIGEIVHTIA